MRTMCAFPGKSMRWHIGGDPLLLRFSIARVSLVDMTGDSFCAFPKMLCADSCHWLVGHCCACYHEQNSFKCYCHPLIPCMCDCAIEKIQSTQRATKPPGFTIMKHEAVMQEALTNLHSLGYTGQTVCSPHSVTLRSMHGSSAQR